MDHCPVRAGGRALLTLVMFALVSAGATQVAPARASSIGVGISPSSIEFSAGPGSTGTEEFTVSNPGTAVTTVDITIQPMDQADGRSAEAWLSVDPTELTLQPNEKQETTLTITVPDDLDAGGYFASMLLTPRSPDAKPDGSSIGGQIRVPIVFVIDGRGDIVRRASLDRVIPVLEPDGRIGMRAVVSNSGNVMVTARGTVLFLDKDDKTYASLDFTRSGRIMPGYDRVFGADGSVPLEEGTQWTAKVDLTYGPDDLQLSAELPFTVTQPTLTVESMEVCENLTSGPTLRVSVRNDSDLGVESRLVLSVQDDGGNGLGDVRIPSPLLMPNETSTFSTEFDRRLDSGNYVFVVVVHSEIATGMEVTEEFPFEVGGIAGDPIPICAPT